MWGPEVTVWSLCRCLSCPSLAAPTLCLGSLPSARSGGLWVFPHNWGSMWSLAASPTPQWCQPGAVVSSDCLSWKEGVVLLSAPLEWGGVPRKDTVLSPLPSASHCRSLPKDFPNVPRLPALPLAGTPGLRAGGGGPRVNLAARSLLQLTKRLQSEGTHLGPVPDTASPFSCFPAASRQPPGIRAS